MLCHTKKKTKDSYVIKNFSQNRKTTKKNQTAINTFICYTVHLF